MANSNQDQALYEMSQILQGDWEAGMVFKAHASMVTFGYLGGGMGGPWRSSLSDDMTSIHRFGKSYLLKNIRLAMLKEVVGLGPQRYHVCFNSTPNFYSKLKLIMSFLPPEIDIFVPCYC